MRFSVSTALVSRLCIVMPALAASACVGLDLDPAVPTADEESAINSEPVHVLDGDNLNVLGVTDDDHVIFNDATSVYVAALYRGAPRTKIADLGPITPAGASPEVYISGKVAFIWPDSRFFGSVTSRLYVWTASSGPQLASSASSPRTTTAAASPDGRDIIFTTNVSADGKTGDIVTSRADLRGEQALVTGVDFRCAQQMPTLVGFDRKARLAAFGPDGVLAGRTDDGGEANPVVGYCPIGSSTALLARWVHGVRHDLASDVRGFPQWSVTHSGSEIFTIVGTPTANQRGVRIDRHDHVEELEDIITRGGTIALDDTIVTFNKPDTEFVMHRFTGEPPRPTVVTTMGSAFTLNSNGLPTFNTDYTSGFDSPGGLMMFGNNTANGQTLFLADTRRNTRVTLEEDAPCGPSFEPFAADSKHALVYCSNVDGTTSLSSIDTSGAGRLINTGDALDGLNFAVERGVITFADDFVQTPDGVQTVDIKLLDLNSSAAAITVAGGVFTNYFPTADRKRIAYSSAAGLFVQRVR